MDNIVKSSMIFLRVMRNEPIQLPSLRNWLLAIHRDLFLIDHFVTDKDEAIQLSEFEGMVLILEDRRFFSHWGVDWISVAREVGRSCLRRKHGGASTIDMQFVRTATGYRQKTVKRKLYEMLLSWLIQFRYSKSQILRSYLNSAFFGSGLIGASSASLRLFELPSDELARDQAARLASMLVYPRPLREGQRWVSNVDRRAKYGLALANRLKEKFHQLPGR